MRGKGFPLVLAAVWAVAGTQALAQEPAGTISGRVTTGGVVVVGADVAMTGEARGLARTDGDGRFSFRNLRPGKYEVIVMVPCLKAWAQTETLDASGITLDVALEPAPMEPQRIVVRDRYSDEPIEGATLYVQDRWTFNSDWTFSPGVRADGYDTPATTLVTGADGAAEIPMCGKTFSERVRDSGIGDDLYWLKLAWMHKDGRMQVKAPDYRPASGHLDTERREQEVHLVPYETPWDLYGKGASLEFGAHHNAWGDLRLSGGEERTTDSLGGVTLDQTGTILQPGQHHEVFLNGTQQDMGGGGLGWQFDTLPPFSGGKQMLANGAPTERRPRSASRAVTSLRAWVGRSRTELEYDKIDDTTPGGRDTLWTGTATVLRFGVAQTLRLGRGRGLYLKASYDYERQLETDMTRSPGLTVQGGRLAEDSGRLGRKEHVLGAHLGWSSRYVSPWAGMRVTRGTVRLTGVAAAQFDSPQGLFERRIEFVNEFESDQVLADFGLDVRIPRTRLFLRALGATDGSDTRFGVGVSYGWFLGR